MTIFRSEEPIVGIVALATIPFVVSILRRGLRDSRLPVGKRQILRSERPGAFAILFILYVSAALLMLYIGLDLLVGL
jgi:hypothetical protein